MKRRHPDARCENLVQDDAGAWHPCGQIWDGTNPDAAPFCARCRAAADAIGAGIIAWIDEQFAAMDAAADEAASAA